METDFRLVMSLAKTIGDQSHIKNDLKLLTYQEANKI